MFRLNARKRKTEHIFSVENLRQLSEFQIINEMEKITELAMHISNQFQANNA